MDKYVSADYMKELMRLQKEWNDFAEGPSENSIEMIIEDVSGEIDEALDSVDIIPPANQTELDAAGRSGLFLIRCCKYGVLADIARVFYGQDGKNKLADSYQKLFDDRIEKIKKGSFKLTKLGKLTNSVTLPDSFITDPEYEDSEPLFTIDDQL